MFENLSFDEESIARAQQNLKEQTKLAKEHIEAIRSKFYKTCDHFKTRFPEFIKAAEFMLKWEVKNSWGRRPMLWLLHASTSILNGGLTGKTSVKASNEAKVPKKLYTEAATLFFETFYKKDVQKIMDCLPPAHKGELYIDVTEIKNK